MSAKHTPGPWEAIRGEVVATSIRYSNGRPNRVCTMEREGIPTTEGYANAARIVACVNACEGIVDPAKAEITFTDYDDGEPGETSCTIEANTVAELLTDAGKLLEQQSKDLSDLRRKYGEAIEALTEGLSYIASLHQQAYGRALPSNNSVAKQLREVIAASASSAPAAAPQGDGDASGVIAEARRFAAGEVHEAPKAEHSHMCMCAECRGTEPHEPGVPT